MYEVLEEGPRYKVKRIEIKPGHRLSLQAHSKRSEHWVVVEGEALVTLDDRQMTVRPNEAVEVPVGTRHRVASVGDGILVFIEVQCGPYLGEDDIVRFEDDYDRISRG